MGQIEYCSRLVAIKDLIQILQGLECRGFEKSGLQL